MKVVKRLVSGDLALLFSFALAKVISQLAVNAFGGYGIFRDELYYIACSDHPAAGYVDQPPFSILVLSISRVIFGDSLFAIRLLPALAAGVAVFLTGLIARELGGGRTAQAFACLGCIVSIINMAMFSYFSMNCFDILFWGLALYLFLRILKESSPRLWLALGVTLGLGVFNKIGVLWLGAGIGIALVGSSSRRVLLTSWPYGAAGIAFLLFLPFAVWNITHDGAHLEFIRNATTGKYSSQTAWTFLAGQIPLQNPINLPLWFGGLIFLLFNRGMRPFLPLAIVYGTGLIILVVNGHSKPEYLSPAYMLLFASGGVMLETLMNNGWRRGLRAGYFLLMLAAGVFLAPVVLPVLPVETYIRYAAAIGAEPSTAEGKALGSLPQFYADMFGWEQKAADVAAVYNALPEEDRKKCALYCDNYGRCGAIDYFGPRLGLPKSIGGHNNYWLWGPRAYTGEVVIVLGGALKDKQENFESVEVAGTSTNPYCMPYENNLKIYVCRGLKVSLPDLWPHLKHYE